MSATADLWRSLEALGDEEIAERLRADYPEAARHIGRHGGPTIDRRRLLTLAGASLALGGLAGCKQSERIVPYVNEPEGRTDGLAQHFATTLPAEAPVAATASARW